MKHQEVNLSFKERVNEGLARNWKLAVIILAAVVVVMAGILIFDTVRSNRIADSAMLAEDIQDAFVEWIQDVPENRDDDDLNQLIDEALTDYPNFFAAQRGLFTRGLMKVEKEDWESAAEDFESLASRWEESYLAPVSLFNAGSAWEQAGNVEAAEKSWTALVDLYADVSPDAPEALFNLGRIAEGRGDTDAALDLYGDIASRFPDSRWTDLSKSRILVIEGRS